MHVLDNGLRILHLPDRSARVTALQLWLSVGSGDESLAESGLAHLHEHMLFKGTRRRGVGEIARAVEGAGGDVNAWTSYDETVYHLVLPSRELGLGLDVLADAAQFSIFDAGELGRETEVVLEEIRRAADSPAHRAQELLFEGVYGGHPYGRQILGSVESVSGFGRDDLLAFFNRHYTPNRALLVISGGGDPDETLALAEEHFGSWDRVGAARADLPLFSPPRPAGQVIGLPCTEAHLDLAMLGPSASDEAAVAADLLAMIVGQGESSRLARGVKRGQGLANEVVGYAFTPRGPGVMLFGATCPPERLLDTARALARELRRVSQDGVSAGELARARQMIESDLLFQAETVQGRARKAGYYVNLFDDPDWEQEYLSRLAAVTPGGLAEAAARLLDPSHISAVAAVPEDLAGQLSGEALLEAARAGSDHRSSARRGSAGEATDLIRRELDGDATLLIRIDRGAPLASARAVVLGGLRGETAETNGFHHLAARLLTRGTGSRSGDALAEAVESLGGGLSGFSGRNSLGLRGEFLASAFPDGLGLLAECLLDPAFSAPEVAREQERTLEAIRHRDDEPSRRAFRLFEETQYSVHPFGMDVLGTAESVGRLDPAFLREEYAAAVLSRPLVLSVVGDVDPDAVAAQVERLLGGRDSQAAAPPDPPAEPPRDARREGRLTLDRQQSHVILGFEGASFRDPDRYALDVLAAVLGGQGGRLFLDLRDRQSLAYAVSAFSLEAYDPGYFALYIGCAPDKTDTAIGGLESHVERLTREAVPDDELEAVKRYLAGAHEIGRQRMSTRAGQLAFDVLYDLGPDNSERYSERILAVTADEVLAAAQRRFALDRATLAVLGPAK